MRTGFLIRSAVAAATVTLCASGAPAATTLNGAGGTAIYPVLSAWAQDYNKANGIEINYQPIGSGGGIQQIEARTVDFANSDKPLTIGDLAKNDLVQFPQVIISIVPVVHLPGIAAGQLRLDGKTLADVYLGKIAKWNDPAIRRLNAKAALPDLAILTVHRADGSGTTFNFTNYLGKVNPEWKSSVGADTSVSWPGGVGAKGNAGVAATVAQSPGSIGYVEYAYAMQNNLTYIDMVNAAGADVKPTMGTFQAAAGNADFSKVKDFYLIPTNQPGAQSWPITAATYMLLRKDYPAAKNRDILKFFDWALKNGQASSRKLGYVPLPENVVKEIEAYWTTSLKAWP